MDRRSLSRYFTYALMLTLITSIFSTALALQPAQASHTNIILDDTIDTEYEPGDTVDISGTIDDVNDDEDRLDLTVTGPGTSDDDDTEHDDGDFEFEYVIDDSADDGIYTIEIEYDGESVITYFLIDEESDDVEVGLDADTYDPGDSVEISGNDIDPETGEDEIEITIEDPDGDDDYSTNAELDGDEYSESVDLDDDAVHGRYAVTVTYAGDEGYAIFEVTDEDDGGSSGDDEIDAQLTDSTLTPGDEVVITGSINENDVDLIQVLLEVEDPDGATVETDSVRPDNDGEFEFRFDLEDDAETGTYEVTLQYEGYDDRTLTFTVSTSGSSGGGSSGGSGSGSGSSSGLTARLSKTSLLAGETITVTGVVPRIADDDPVNISVLRPDGTFVVASFPEPASDKTYSATLRLPATLTEDEDYTVVVYYDEKEVKVNFDITGKTTGGTGGAITVETDKATYSVGSTVRITGEIASDSFIEGQQIALQVFNPEKAPYRFDPITPESDGTYSYSLVIGGPLGVTGEWEVKVTYSGQVAETSFDLTGGVASTPKYNLKVEDKTFPIEYRSDGSVKSMFVRAADKKLVVSIDAEEDGKLTIVLPREVIDAARGGSDIKYVVATSDIDTGAGDSIDVTESSTNGEYRTLVINYEAGTDLIEIQGTSVVPEFGPLSAIILAVAVFSIVAITARFSGRLGSFRQW